MALSKLTDNPRFLRDLLTDATKMLQDANAENRRLRSLVQTKDAQIALLTANRVDFDLSADSEMCMFFKRQIG